MRSCAVAVVLLCLAGIGHADDWPGFRGVERQNVAPGSAALEAAYPLHWSRIRNVRWHTPLPGEGHSSPIVLGDAVFLSYPIEQPQPAHMLTGVRVGFLVVAWALLATSDLHEPVSASLAPVDGRLYVRTGKALWCLERR